MTAHVSKEQLALMLPGTMSLYDHERTETRETPRRGLFARIAATISDWAGRQGRIDEVAALSDAQLADIGISRAEVPLIFSAGFATRRDQDRTVAILQAGRIAGV
jgi:uncharacterized protein YjiS (DUF1127 family)